LQGQKTLHPWTLAAHAYACRFLLHNCLVTVTQPVYERGTMPPKVGAILRSARLRLGWTQEEAAYECRITDRHLRYLEAGARRPSDTVAERLIDGLRLKGRAVSQVRAAAVVGWGSRHGRPLVKAAGRQNRRRARRPVVTTHKGSCWEHLSGMKHPWLDAG
jgi:hypothetical protein